MRSFSDYTNTGVSFLVQVDSERLTRKQHNSEQVIVFSFNYLTKKNYMTKRQAVYVKAAGVEEGYAGFWHAWGHEAIGPNRDALLTTNDWREQNLERADADDRAEAWFDDGYFRRVATRYVQRLINREESDEQQGN